MNSLEVCMGVSILVTPGVDRYSCDRFEVVNDMAVEDGI